MANKNTPVISVIIQTRETPFMILKRCIQSIREQTWPTVEILLLDSNDENTIYKDAIHAEKEYFEGIVHLEIPETGEFIEGKNAALEAYHGEYITLISAQDIMPPNRLEEIMHYFEEHPSCSAVYTDMTAQEGNVLEQSDFQLFSRDYFYLAQIVMHKNCLRMVGNFDSNMIAQCDEDLWFRLHTMKLIWHLSSPETTISVCTDCYDNSTALDAAIGYRQLCVKYRMILRKHPHEKKKLYHKIAARYKEAKVYHRYIQFAVKEFFIRG